MSFFVIGINEEDCQISKPKNLILFFFKLIIDILSQGKFRHKLLFKKFKANFLIFKQSFFVPQTKIMKLSTNLTYVIFRLTFLQIKRLISLFLTSCNFANLSLLKSFQYVHLLCIFFIFSISCISALENLKNAAKLYWQYENLSL